MTGLEGPSASAAFAHSFPQPTDLDDDSSSTNTCEGASSHFEATTDAPPAISVPRASYPLDGTAPAQVKAKAPEPEVHNPTEELRKPSDKSKASAKTGTTSFRTAHESVGDASSPRLSAVPESSFGGNAGRDPGQCREGLENRASTNGTTTPSMLPTSSTTSLLKHGHEAGKDSEAASHGMNDGPPTSSGYGRDAQPTEDSASLEPTKVETGLVRFDLPSDDIRRERQGRMRDQARKRGPVSRLRKDKVKDGEIVKVQNMLVRVEFTAHDIPADFTENDSEKMESRTIDKWKEYMVVCREYLDDETPFLLEMYRTRVIPVVEKSHTKRKCTHQIPLNRNTCKISLFSSLDKTMVIWVPSRKAKLVYILQARSGADSMEWYTFLRNTLGWNRNTVLQVNVPDLAANLRLENPFEKLESVRDLADGTDNDEAALLRTMAAEQVAAAVIIQRCLKMLERSEFSDVVSAWAADARIGLAWKRYDRLEWVHGANEKKMYGTIGMDKSHELELRPKQHYPTAVRIKKGESATEPAPVEGFLIRLTSQRGATQRFGRMFFKRLYFSTHNQFLVFNRPARADPPPSPNLPMRQDASIPGSHQISEKIPLIYSVNPFPLLDGQIQWLADAETSRIKHDRDAYDENDRKLGLVLKCDGVVNLCNVIKIRNVKRGAVPADGQVDSGSDVDFDQEVDDSRQDDGSTHVFDDQRTFELVLKNGLVIRLQAFDKVTKQEWIKRLQKLADYWKARTAADINLYKTVRRQNLERLAIDEQSESYVGQFARKWEVTNSFASPELYHMCGVGCCRSIHMSGILWRRPRMRAPFERNLVILSHGRLLLFQDALRGRDGRLIQQIHHERVGSLDLSDCYIYSGLITEHDMLYTSKPFDRSHPGRHALPRMYVEDGWSSTDEDTMTCFVIWHGKRSSWFRSQGLEEDGRTKRQVKKVSSLGKEGRSVVFKCRSRAERDHWVMSVAMEVSDGTVNAGYRGDCHSGARGTDFCDQIERLAIGDDVRLVGDEGKK